MKNRKWPVPLCAGVILALGAIAAVWFLGQPVGRLSLYDFVRSLPDDGYYVDRSGFVWQLSYSDAGSRYVKKTAERSGRDINTRIDGPDEELATWEFALVSGGLLCQDGSLWHTNSATTTTGGSLRIRPYLTEAPVQEAVENDTVSVGILSVSRAGNPIRSSDRAIVSASCVLPEAVDWQTVTARSAVLLGGIWFQTGGEWRMKDSTSISFWPLPALPEAVSLPKGRIPAGHYRLELYTEGEPLCFLPYRISWEGTVITLTEEGNA